jgi:hypothetical protein
MKNQNKNIKTEDVKAVHTPVLPSNYFLICHYFSEKVKRLNEMNLQATL